MKQLVILVFILLWTPVSLAKKISCKVAVGNFAVFENLDKSSYKVLRQAPVAKAYKKFMGHASEYGIKELANINSYNIEPIQGLPGIYSARLSRGYRLFFRLVSSETEKNIEIVHIGLHDYERFQKRAVNF